MATTTRSPRSGQVDEEFLHHLYQGGELLAAGKVIEAKDYLEKAHKLQPKNEKGQNLLGLTYFKLGLFDRAAEIYELLVRENPADPTLRVNLGLVYLKSNALQRAIREFETATDLAPEHAKAQNYLGLALAQAGEYGRAKEHFILAGSEAMAEKMDRALAGEEVLKPIASPAQKRGFAEIEGSEVVAERGAEVPAEQPPSVNSDWGAVAAASSGQPVPVEEKQAPPPPPAQPEEEEIKFAEDEGPPAPIQDISPRSKTGEFIAVSEPPPPPPPEEAPVAEVSWEEPPPSEMPTIEVGELDQQATPAAREAAPVIEAPRPPPLERRAAPALEVVPSAPKPSGASAQLEHRAPELLAFRYPTDSVFTPAEDGMVASVNGELLVRLWGCAAVLGQVTFEPERKRYRGRPADKGFGEGERQFMRASGTGAVLISAGKKRFEVVDLGDDSAYFREDVVAAFEEPLMFENGRVPGEGGKDLDLVHLRGTGKALLSLDAPMRALEVKMDRPAMIPLEKLVGWVGSVSPRMTRLWRDDSAPVAVELSGEGFVFCTVQL